MSGLAPAHSFKQLGPDFSTPMTPVQDDSKLADRVLCGRG
jgi:hypothetical protein